MNQIFCACHTHTFTYTYALTHISNRIFNPEREKGKLMLIQCGNVVCVNAMCNLNTFFDRYTTISNRY